MGLTHGELIARAINDDPDFRRDWERLAPARKLAAELIRYRSENQLSQRALADQLGVRQPRVARLESGEHNPAIETIAHIVKVTGIEFCIDFLPTGQSSKLLSTRAKEQASSSVAEPGVSVIAASA